VAQSAEVALRRALLDIPSDASCIEHQRDLLLHTLATHRVVHVLTIAWVIGVVGFIGFIIVLFPLKFGLVQWNALGWDEEQAQHWWVIVNTILCSLFTWQNALTFPWRLSVAIHLLPCACCCKKRCADPGLDFYGRPTEAMFFHLATRQRAIIIALLNGAVLLQFVQQVARGFYATYESSEESADGVGLIMTSFLGSIACAVGGGAYQFCCLYKLHEEESERFPPSAVVVAVQHVVHAWHVKGERNCCTIVRGSLAEFKERTKQEKAQATVRRESVVAPRSPPPSAQRQAPPGQQAVADASESSTGVPEPLAHQITLNMLSSEDEPSSKSQPPPPRSCSNTADTQPGTVPAPHTDPESHQP